MSVLFASDFHFDHKNVIEYCNRPFSSVEEMNEAMIANWNKVVGEKDDIYVVGDFAFSDPRPFAARLNGRKYLIKGNHDYRWESKLNECFEWVKDLHVLRHEKQHIMLCHYAMRVWYRHHHGAWHLYGHSHGSLPGQGRSADVGVDVRNFTPVSFEKIKEEMENIVIPVVDHHKPETK